jgi:hypothetical protein
MLETYLTVFKTEAGHTFPFTFPLSVKGRGYGVSTLRPRRQKKENFVVHQISVPVVLS